MFFLFEILIIFYVFLRIKRKKKKNSLIYNEFSIGVYIKSKNYSILLVVIFNFLRELEVNEVVVFVGV